MVYDPATKSVILFGGGPNGNNGGGEYGDTWAWDGTWTKLNPSASPSAREHASMTYDVADSELVLFGGNYGNTYFSDTWTFQNGNWQQSSASGPAARAAAEMTYDAIDGYVVLFGGTRDFRYAGESLDDTWKFIGGSWTQLSPSQSPYARYTFAMSYDPAASGVLIFGGWDSDGNVGGGCGGGSLNDTWLFTGGNWYQQFPSASPSLRQEVSMSYLPEVSEAILFGGENGDVPCGGGSGTPVFGDTWAYGPSAVAFQLEASPSSLTIPASGSGSFIVSAVGMNGFTCTAPCISLSVSGLPLSTTYTFTQPTISPGYQSTLTVSAYAFLEGANQLPQLPAIGSYDLLISGHDNGVTSSASVSLTIANLEAVNNSVVFAQGVFVNNPPSGPACPGLFESHCFTIQQNIFVIAGGALYWVQDAVGYGVGLLGPNAYSAFYVWSVNLASGTKDLLACSGVVVSGNCDSFYAFLTGVGASPTFDLNTTVTRDDIFFNNSLDGSPTQQSTGPAVSLPGRPCVYVGPQFQELSTALYVDPPQVIFGGPPGGGEASFRSGAGLVYSFLAYPGGMYFGATVLGIVLSAAVPGYFVDQSGETSEEVSWTLPALTDEPSLFTQSGSPTGPYGSWEQGVSFGT